MVGAGGSVVLGVVVVVVVVVVVEVARVVEVGVGVAGLARRVVVGPDEAVVVDGGSPEGDAAGAGIGASSVAVRDPAQPDGTNMTMTIANARGTTRRGRSTCASVTRMLAGGARPRPRHRPRGGVMLDR